MSIISSRFFLLFILLILITLNGLTVFAEQYYLQISIKGLSTVSYDQVINYLKIDTNKSYQINELFSLESALKDWGYFAEVSVQIHKISDTTINVAIEISENPILHSISIYINGKENFILVHNLKSIIGIAFNQKKLNDDIDILYKIPYVINITSKKDFSENKVLIKLDISKDTPLVFRSELWDYSFNTLSFENIDFILPVSVSFSLFYDFQTSFIKDIQWYPYIFIQLFHSIYLFYGYNIYSVDHNFGIWMKSTALQSLFFSSTVTELNAYAYVTTRSSNDTLFINGHIKTKYNYQKKDIEIFWFDRTGSRVIFGGSEFFDNPSIDIINFFLYCRGIENKTILNTQWAIALSLDTIILFFKDSLINAGIILSSDAVFFETQYFASFGFGIYGELSFLSYISFPVSCSVFIANDTGFSKVSFIMQFGSFRL